MYVRLVMHCWHFPFNTRQSVNVPTLGDYKLQNTIEHAISDGRFIKKVV